MPKLSRGDLEALSRGVAAGMTKGPVSQSDFGSFMGGMPAPPRMAMPDQVPPSALGVGMPKQNIPLAPLPTGAPPVMQNMGQQPGMQGLNQQGPPPGFKRGGKVTNSGDDLKEMRDPAAKHHNPKMKTDEPAKLAIGGGPMGAGMAPPGAMAPAAPMRPRRPRRPITPRMMPAAAPAGMPVMKKGGYAGGSAGEKEEEEGDHAGADEKFKKGGAAKFKKGGSADPAMHNAKKTDSAKHGNEGGGPGEIEDGFKTGGVVGYAAGGGIIPIRKADRHPGKKIGSIGPLIKKYKAGGAVHVKGHHEEGHHHQVHQGHGSHGHKTMKSGGKC
jgi:hypothetical protein